MLSLAWASVVQAQQFTETQFTYYRLGNGTVMITDYNGAGGDVTIPGTLGGLPVKAIGVGTFQNKTTVTRVTLPNGVTSIGYMAFSGCTGLTCVYFSGNAPDEGGHFQDIQATVYYLQGTAGWGRTFGGRPTAPWRRGS